MERLTTRTQGLVIKCVGCIDGKHCYSEIGCDAIYDALEKLKEYKDLEEQGKLIKLPCKVGTEVHCIIENRCMHYLSKDCWNCSGQEFANACYEPDKTIRKYAFVIEMLDELGKTVFLTKEEAEKALAEMGE